MHVTHGNAPFLSRLIAQKLFTSKDGKSADRLVLFQEPDRSLQYDLGGWAAKPAADAIERVIHEFLAAEEKPWEPACEPTP